MEGAGYITSKLYRKHHSNINLIVYIKTDGVYFKKKTDGVYTLPLMQE
jgi:hypothetical protein